MARLKSYVLDRKIDELDKAISLAARDPASFGITQMELEKRRKWTKTAHDQVNNVRKAVSAGKGLGIQGPFTANGMHQELTRLPADYSHQSNGSSKYNQDNDDFISSESDRQMLLIKYFSLFSMSFEPSLSLYCTLLFSTVMECLPKCYYFKHLQQW